MAWRVPLAWLNLSYRPRHLITALAGVAFAVLLMFVFRGFENALYDSQVQLLKLLNGDIVIVNIRKYTMFVPEQFARRRIYQAQAFEGIEAGYALYINNAAYWKNPVTKRVRPLRVLAFNPNEPVLPLPGIAAHQKDLEQPWTVLLDEKARPEVGPAEAGIETELAEQQARVVGTFRLGTDFASGNGNIVMSDRNFLRYFAQLGDGQEPRTLGTVDIGLLKVAPGCDAKQLAAQIAKALPKDVKVVSKADFIAGELKFWRENTSIGFVFTLLTTMSFLVGIILVYQILYTDIADHWVEYATLKAIGYNNRYLLGLVFQESLLLAFLGFIPGFAFSVGLYGLAASATGLLMQMTFQRALNILIATCIMCSISGAIAMRKIQTTDPAEVFGI